jgi:hypothetical protein
MSDDRLRRVVRAAIDLGAVGAAVVFTASYFPREIMFSPTITNGGDMGSHYYPGLYMRDVLLPKGQVSGWCPGNYCGYPIFQFYFPLPFLLMAAASTVMPYAVAFKLGTVLGTLLMPICAYVGLRLLGSPFPGPAIGSLATLCFTFMEANSMWGGNIPSTLAGEFSLSLGLSLTVLFFGTIHWAAATGRGVAWNGLLEALIGLAHGYTLLWAGFSSLLELVATRGWWRRVGVLAGVHLLAILLLGFWLFPMLGYSAWTTAYNHSWPLAWKDWKEVMPPILWPAAGIAVGTAVLEAVICLLRRTPFPRGLATLWGVMGVAVLFYFTAHSFNVVDIRFVPFVQLGLCLAAGAGLGYVLDRVPGVEVLALAAPLAVLPFVQRHVTFIPSWIRWNYSGFEAKGPWATLHGISERLRGDFRAPRVVYEHTPANEALGTVRAFEDLPLFSGRSTLEGLYMQGSPSAPFVFYLQSELSQTPSCPFPDWGCARFNLDRGIEHLRMMNVSDFIVRSDAVKAAAAKNPGLEKIATEGPYEIYRVRDNDPHYAVPLAVAPYLVVGEGWKEKAYRWFRRAGPDDPIPVFAERVTPDEERLFAGVSSDLPETMAPRPLGPAPALHEEMPAPDRLVITGTTPGHPVLIRISYHPRWHARTGERIWLAGPSFMLVFPRGDRVELEFGEGPPVVLGWWATRLGLLLFLLAVLPGVGPAFGRLLAQVGRGLAAVPPGRWAVEAVRRTAGWSPGVRRLFAAAALVLAAASIGTAAAVLRKVPIESTYRQGQALFNAGKMREARPYFQEVQRQAPLSTTAIHSRYFEAITYFRENEWKKAEDVFRRLVHDFPDGLNAPEALYHVGLCRLNQGDREGAIENWEAVRERYPDSPWAKHSADRLAEVRK